jgi:transcriptional regulator with GAF, ATPase, and Fis domain
MEMQSKLLRVLQEGQFERVGDERTRKVDVRVVAATNRNLKREVEKGLFRQDLYYRLNVFPIEVPPLRDRRDDIPLLAAYFLETVAREMNRSKPRFTRANSEQLRHYDWPGNVRELRNVIERAVIRSKAGSLPLDLDSGAVGSTVSVPETTVNGIEPVPDAATETTEVEVIPELEMRQRERQNLLLALEKTRWRIYGSGGAAELLGIKPSTLSSRLKKLGLKKPDEMA